MDEHLLIEQRRHILVQALADLDLVLQNTALAYVGGDGEAWLRFTNAYDSLQSINRELDLLLYAEKKLGITSS